MTNAFGVKLDSNGYAPSIVHPIGDACFRCDYMGELARHEIFNGSYRGKSKALGLWVYLCQQCHALIHRERDERMKLKVIGQRDAMYWYDWSTDDFRKEFGKNYDT